MDNCWGDYEVAANQTLRWQLGSKTLLITRGDNEWKVASADGQDRLDDRLAIAEQAKEQAGNDDDIDVKRFATRSGSQSIRLGPALPDLDVVVRTTKPLFVPAMGESALLPSAPLWLRLYFNGRGVELMDIPIARPSPTWSGPDTTTGDAGSAIPLEQERSHE